MAKRKTKKRRKKSTWKKFKKRYFGDKFNGWDIFLLAIVVGFPIYIIVTQGFAAFGIELGYAIYSAVVVGFIIRQVINRSKK